MNLEKFNYDVDGQLSLFDNCKTEYKIKKPVRLIELFAGIGSQAMALKCLGVDFEHYKVIEFDKYAISSYNAIHETNFVPTDITRIKGTELEIVDVERFTYLLTYSFPCQDLSVAGKQKGMTKGSGTRSGLLWEVERLLNEVENLPQVLLMENVPQVHSKANMPDFLKWIEFLERKGYSNYWKDLNAKNYGVAQNRNRCFMVSILGDYLYEFPKEFALEKRMKDYLEDEVDKKYYITTEKAKKLIEKLILEGKILTDKQTNRQTDKQTNRQTDRQLTFAANKQKTLNFVTQSKQDMTQELQTSNMTIQESANGEDVVNLIKKYGNKNANYVPYDCAVSYPLTSQDFIRTGFMDECPTIASRDYKEPKIVVKMENIKK